MLGIPALRRLGKEEQELRLFWCHRGNLRPVLDIRNFASTSKHKHTNGMKKRIFISWHKTYEATVQNPSLVCSLNLKTILWLFSW